MDMDLLEIHQMTERTERHQGKSYLRGAVHHMKLTDSCRRCAVPVKSGAGVCEKCWKDMDWQQRSENNDE